MRFFAVTFFSLLLFAVTVSAVPASLSGVVTGAVRHLFRRACHSPEDDEIQKMTGPLKKKWDAMCKTGMVVGDKKDVDWVEKHVVSYYASKAFIGKDLPNGWKADYQEIKRKCHKNTYNYCVKETREKVAECYKEEAAGLIPKYALQVPAYCPAVEKIISEWPTKHQAKAMGLITKFCKANGKKC